MTTAQHLDELIDVAYKNGVNATAFRKKLRLRGYELVPVTAYERRKEARRRYAALPKNRVKKPK